MILSQNVSMTKKDIFYMNIKLFRKQTISDVVIEDIACMFNCMRASLNIFVAGKWVVIGYLSFMEDDHTIDCTKHSKVGKAIPKHMENVEIVHGKIL